MNNEGDLWLVVLLFKDHNGEMYKFYAAVKRAYNQSYKYL